MNRDREDQRNREPTNAPNNSDQEGEIQHIVDTGLPPGIDIEDAKDPGNSPETPRPREKK